MENLKITFFEEVDDLDDVSVFKCVECKSLWKLRMKSDYKYCPECGSTVATRDVYNKYIEYLNNSIRAKKLYDEIVNEVSADDNQQALNYCNNDALATDDEWSVSINNERTKIKCPACSHGKTFRYDDGRASHWVILPQYCECCGKKMKNGGTKV